MIESLETIDRADVCGSCGTSVGGRYILHGEGAALVSFCSETCLQTALTAQRKRRWKARRRGMKVAVIGAAVAGACLAPHQGWHPPPAPPARAPAAAADTAAPSLPAGWFGPEWPPSDTSLLAALGRDAWIHPLAGPVRRMPIRDSRVFGAVRPGNRAVECRNGHCGVDLGGEIWGEHIRAVHDGVVDFVRRGPYEQHGGQFVRISHRNGTVFTQYFHVAAIPRWIERGAIVKAGDVVGLLGDTGVKDSAPHLHFSISVRLSPDRPDKYFDPEPLMALWPLRIPIEGSDAGLVTTVSEPGVPLGSMPLLSSRKRKLAVAAHKKRGGAAAAAADTAEAPSSGDEGSPGPSVDESSGDE